MVVDMVHQSARPQQRETPLSRTKTEPQAATAPPLTVMDQKRMATAAPRPSTAPHVHQAPLSNVWSSQDTTPPTARTPPAPDKPWTCQDKLQPTSADASDANAPPQPP